LGCIFATKARIDNQKRSCQTAISHPRPHNMANVGPLTTEIGLPVWGTSAHFNGFHVLASLLQRRHSPEANQTLYVSWAATLHTFLGDLAPNGILPRAKFTLCPSLVFAWIGNVTAWHSSRGHHQTLWRGTRNGIMELLQRAPPIFGRAAITLGIGPHSSSSLLFKSIPQYIPRATASRLVLHKSNHKLVSYWCCHAADISQFFYGRPA